MCLVVKDGSIEMAKKVVHETCVSVTEEGKRYLGVVLEVRHLLRVMSSRKCLNG